MTCAKTQGFLAKHKVETASQVDARKATLREKEALALVGGVDEVYASKGKQVVHLDIKRDKPDAATLKGLLLGPTGNLRAPTLRKGRTLIVGFDEATYAKLLK
jgi:arsenate reductase-like glutaredoxin family protein